MKQLKDNLPTILGVVSACVLVLVFIWLILAMTTGFINAQNQMRWCEGVNGDSPYSEGYQETGKRWSPNPFTAGLTGECIDPGDKGL